MAERKPGDQPAKGLFARGLAEMGFSSWTAAVRSMPLGVRVAVSLLLLAGVGLLDVATGPEISFSVFYLVPVLFAGTFGSPRAGRTMAVASAATWGLVDVFTGDPYSAVWIPVWNSVVRLVFFLLIVELVETLQLTLAAQRTLARTDSLTGIANARVFSERLDQVIARSRRDGRAFTITYIDLDRFKQVNDTFGHSEGDRLLREVAEIMGRGIRATDVVARLGGDEFGLLMPETDAEHALTSLERIAAALALELGKRWGVGATFGAVTFDIPPGDADSAVQMADKLMYSGKGGASRILQESWPDTVHGVAHAGTKSPKYSTLLE